MKIKTTCKSKQDETIEFPSHFRADDGLVVLAFDMQAGVVVTAGADGENKVGEYSIDWIRFDQKDTWTQVKHKTTFED